SHARDRQAPCASTEPPLRKSATKSARCRKRRREKFDACGERPMSGGRCDVPGKLMMTVRFGNDGRAWLASLRADHVKYSLAQAMWQRGDGDEPRQLVDVHAAFVGE